MYISTFKNSNNGNISSLLLYLLLPILWIEYLHFLLHLTGSKTLQPLIDETEDIVIIFNGEIYNYKEILNDAKSDIYSIMYLYKKYGLDFTKYLDGEFTIVIFDFKQNLLLLLQ